MWPSDRATEWLTYQDHERLSPLKMLKIRQIGWKISKKSVIHWKILFRTKSEWLSLKILLMVPKTTGHLLLSCQHNLHLWWCVKFIEVLWKLFVPPDCVIIVSPLVCKNVCPSPHLPTVYENCLYLPPVMCKIVCHPLCVKMFVGPPPYVCEKYLFLMVKKHCCSLNFWCSN